MKTRSFNLIVILALLLSLLGSALTVTPARAASFTVNTTNDTIDANPGNGICADAAGDCSLRAAIQEANALAGTDAITFAANYTITLGSQLPAITTQMTITGNGAANTIIQASTCNPVTLPGGCTPAAYRVFEVSTGNLTLDSLTVRHGVCSGSSSCLTDANNGGGIYNAGTLTLINSTLSSNASIDMGGGNFDGGGIYNTGTLTVTNSTLSGNSAKDGRGGGIYNSGTITISDTTMSENRAQNSGGGLFNIGSGNISNSTFYKNSTISSNSGLGGGILNSGVLTITNTTFSDNFISISATDPIFASAYGGGIYNSGTLTLINSTLSGNSSRSTTNQQNSRGGGIINTSGSTLNLKNTILANNTADTAGNDCYNASGDTIATNTNNLIESNATSGNMCGTPLLTSDPNLAAALADNGGLTKTIALLSPSVAIDAGDNTTCASTDQRGVLRPQGAACDIGAFELDTTYPTVVTTSLQTAYSTGPANFTINFSENLNDPLGDADIKDVTNPANYLVVEKGTNGLSDTLSCAGGVKTDDTNNVPVNSVTFNASLFTATVNFASALPNGSYRLFVCGTTSIRDIALNTLNGGTSDFTFDFTVGAVTVSTTDSTRASSLPKTGFAPNKISSLPTQPATLEYSKLGDLWLEIPSLNVKSSIVGVPQSADKTWDVTWLGNDTGWLNGTAFPTWNGNSVLTAHVVNASGLEGPFAALKSLKYGDQIIVHMGGVKYVYEVRETRLARPYSTNYAFESKSDAAYLTLITCQGYNPLNESYLFRRVVRAVLIEVK